MPQFLKAKEPLTLPLAIIETFSKLREISRNITALSIVDDKKAQQSLMHKNSTLLTEIFDDEMQISDTETSIEFNFAVVKFRHTIKKKKQ